MDDGPLLEEDVAGLGTVVEVQPSGTPAQRENLDDLGAARVHQFAADLLVHFPFSLIILANTSLPVMRNRARLVLRLDMTMSMTSPLKYIVSTMSSV